MDRARRNFTLNVAEGVCFSVAIAFISQTATLPLFVRQYTASDQAVGAIPALYMLLLSLPQVMGAATAAVSNNFWRLLQVQFLLPRLPFCLLAVVPWLPRSWALPVFFVMWSLFSLMLGFQNPMWYEFVSEVIPPGDFGRFFGLRYLFSGVGGLLAAGAASLVLAAFPGRAGFSLCFALGALFACISYAGIMATRHEFRPRQQTWTSDSRRILEHANFRRYVLARFVLAGSAMAVAFYIVYAQAHYRLSLEASSLLAVALVHVPNLIGLPLGRLADRIGNRPPQLATALLAAVGNLVMAAGCGLTVFIVALLMVGCANAMMQMLDSKWMLELDPDRCGAAVSYFNLALLPATAGLPMLAGIVAQHVGMHAVFNGTALLWGAGALLLVFVREPATSSPR
ncbi:MAG: MFS transporter [Candidatus Xenobia bacterium]